MAQSTPTNLQLTTVYPISSQLNQSLMNVVHSALTKSVNSLSAKVGLRPWTLPPISKQVLPAPGSPHKL